MQAMGRCNCTNLKFNRGKLPKERNPEYDKRKRSDVLETHKTTSADSSDIKHNETQVFFACPTCDRKYMSRDSLREHIKLKHASDGTMQLYKSKIQQRKAPKRKKSEYDKRKRSDVLETHKTTSADSSDIKHNETQVFFARVLHATENICREIVYVNI